MPKLLQIVGGNLYRLAAEQLGDATQWVRIAQLNGLTDPFIVGPLLLTIPDIDATLTGGVPTLPIQYKTTAPKVPFQVNFNVSGLSPGGPTPVPVPIGPTPTPITPTPIPTPTPTPPTPTPTPQPIPTPIPTPTPTPINVPLTYWLIDNGQIVMTIIVNQGEDIESTDIMWPIGALDGILVDQLNNYLVDDQGNFLDATTELFDVPNNDDVCIDDDGDYLIDENGNFLDDSDEGDTFDTLVDDLGNQLVDDQQNFLIDGGPPIITINSAIDDNNNQLVDEQLNPLLA